MSPPVQWIDLAEQTHTSMVFGDRYILKVFRQIEEGTHPEVEVGRLPDGESILLRRGARAGSPGISSPPREPITLAVLHRFVPNEGVAWQLVLDELSRYFEHVLSLSAEEQKPALTDACGPVAVVDGKAPAVVAELIGRPLELARVSWGNARPSCTALARDSDDQAFAPEPFTQLYQRGMYQSIRHLHQRVLDRLHQRLGDLAEADGEDARRVLDRSAEILKCFDVMLRSKVTAQRHVPTVISTSARCCSPARISSSSIWKAKRAAR